MQETTERTPRRIEFQTLLEDILGSRNVYFQPPSNFKLSFPCIVYTRARPGVQYADDLKYKSLQRYTVTYIDKNPDSEIPTKLAALRYSSFDRYFTSDHLNHEVYSIYF